MRKLRVLVLMHEDLVPPESLEGYSEKEILEWKTEFDVVHTLGEMRHDALPLGVRDDLAPIRKALDDYKPHVTLARIKFTSETRALRADLAPLAEEDFGSVFCEEVIVFTSDLQKEGPVHTAVSRAKLGQ